MRTWFQAGSPSLAIFLSIVTTVLVASCDDDSNAPPRYTTETLAIRDVDYIKNTFFYIDDPSHFLGAFPYSVEVYLQVTVQEMLDNPDIEQIPGWAVADSTTDGAMIDSALVALQAGHTPAYAYSGYFRHLVRGTDYSLLMEDTVVVGIELKKPVPPTDEKIVAIRYRNQLGDVGLTFAGTLFLEMIKPIDPRPTGPFASTWRLAMRNAYNLGFAHITPGTLSVSIEDLLDVTRLDTSHPTGSTIPYVQIFGLDRHGASGSGPPDGKIDNFFLNREQDLERGILWMPTPRAFAPPADLVQAWTNGQFEFTGAYLPQYETAEHIYDLWLSEIGEADTHQYIIKATVTTLEQ